MIQRTVVPVSGLRRGGGRVRWRPNEWLDFNLVPVIEDAEGDVDLGVDDTLGGEGADHVVGDELVILGSAQAGEHGFIGFHEALEVLVGVEGAGLGEGEGGGVVALAEGDEGFRGRLSLRGGGGVSTWGAASIGEVDWVAGLSGGDGFLRAIILKSRPGKRAMALAMCRTLRCQGKVKVWS